MSNKFKHKCNLSDQHQIALRIDRTVREQVTDN